MVNQYLGIKKLILSIICIITYFSSSFAYGEQAKYFEMERFPKIKHRKFGAVSMINNGQDMHGSQVFF